MMPMEKYLRQLQREAERDKRGRSTGWHAGLQVWVDDDSSVARAMKVESGELAQEQGREYRTDAAVCTFCQVRDAEGTARSYEDGRYPSCGQQGCGVEFQHAGVYMRPEEALEQVCRHFCGTIGHDDVCITLRSELGPE